MIYKVMAYFDGSNIALVWSTLCEEEDLQMIIVRLTQTSLTGSREYPGQRLHKNAFIE